MLPERDLFIHRDLAPCYIPACSTFRPHPTHPDPSARIATVLFLFSSPRLSPYVEIPLLSCSLEQAIGSVSTPDCSPRAVPSHLVEICRAVLKSLSRCV